MLAANLLGHTPWRTNKRRLVVALAGVLLACSPTLHAQGSGKQDGGNGSASVSLSVVPGVMVLDMNTFNGCSMSGDAKNPDERALNWLKNRWSSPGSGDWDRSVSLLSLLAAQGTPGALNERKAGVIEGICVSVKAGGAQSSNCHKRGEDERDTVIDLVPAPRDFSSRRVQVVVSPRWRNIMRQLGQDWTTQGLQSRLLGQRVRVAGWLLLDTAWTLHPVTQIEIVGR